MDMQEDYDSLFSISESMCFSKDDLIELAEEVLYILNQDNSLPLDSSWELEGIWSDYDLITLDVITPDGDMIESSNQVDFRGIRVPADLLEYAPVFAEDILNERK